uniref:Protein kinase cAMP-dependent X-linked catalytic subunit n=1 Tax=Monodelphis domestica TaxID=13616 RepID=A0A5F8GZW0_MONDO
MPGSTKASQALRWLPSKVLQHRGVFTATKLKVYNAVVLSSLLYGCMDTVLEAHEIAGAIPLTLPPVNDEDPMAGPNHQSGSPRQSQLHQHRSRCPQNPATMVWTRHPHGPKANTRTGTGTFGRVHLVKERTAKHYFALKVMSIPDVIRLKQEQHVHNEKSVLKEVSHPFLIRLYWTYHDERFLYMLMEYDPGEYLFSYVRDMGRFNNSTGLFYSAEIICAIEYLHSKEIVYRDLKPENILLDKEGHIKLTDFGFAKKLLDRTWTLCGTPEYLAPEVIQSKGHGRAVDWWALGILIFEMLSGFPPFFDDNPFGIYQKILAGKIDFPRHLDLYVKDLIKKLLVVDRTRRLGNMKNGADDVKKHRWFRSVDWDAVPQRKLKPPIVPKVSNDGDTSNFEAYPEDDWNKMPPVPPKDLEIFKNF